MAILTPDILKRIEARTGTSDLKRTQFNIRLPGGEIIPAGINPSQAATIDLGGGGVSDLSTSQGRQIARQFEGMNVTNPQEEMARALRETPLAPQKPTLPAPTQTATSVVDYLRGKGYALKGQMSGFDERKRIYESQGLDKLYGDYRGSEMQNTKFLQHLQSQEQPSPAIRPLPLTAQEIAGQEQQKLAVPQQFRDLIPPTPKIELTPDQILAEVRKRPGVQFAEQEAAQAKALLGPAAEAEKERIGQAASERGVAFSPRFFEQPRAAVDAGKIAKELNIDLSLAKVIASSMEQDQAERQKEETSRIKDIKDYYKTLGYAYNAVTQELEKIPESPSEKRAVAAAERSERAEERAVSAEKRAREKFEQEQKKVGEGGFTPSQKSAGAFRAGMGASEFNKLPAEVKNYYVNISDKQATDQSDMFTNLRTGEESAEDAKIEITNSNMAPSVKQYFIEKINSIPLVKTQSSWDKFTNWLGF